VSNPLPTKTTRRASIAARIASSTVAPALVAGGVYLLVFPDKYNAAKAAMLALGLSPAVSAGILVPLVIGAVWGTARYWRRELSDAHVATPALPPGESPAAMVQRPSPQHSSRDAG
jgi:hypothetical protein